MTILYFDELVANYYEFVRSHLCIFTQEDTKEDEIMLVTKQLPVATDFRSMNKTRNCSIINIYQLPTFMFFFVLMFENIIKDQITLNKHPINITERTFVIFSLLKRTFVHNFGRTVNSRKQAATHLCGKISASLTKSLASLLDILRMRQLSI